MKKTIFAACAIVCFALSASAQDKYTGLLKNKVKELQGLYADTNLNKLTLPETLSPGNYFSLPKTAAPLAAVPGLGNTQMVYSRMPVARIASADKMPVAKAGTMQYSMLVKKIKVADPLALAAPGAVGR